MIKLPNFCGISLAVEILIAKENTNSHIINKPSRTINRNNNILIIPTNCICFEYQICHHHIVIDQDLQSALSQ
ncbi:MAG: hypothetical protein K0S91_1830 [Nitrososphaeraceae archaeon]|nr:hypothetical protein [Nitrososphaeraceae archaeon]